MDDSGPHKEITGGCYCGDIRFRAVGPLKFSVNCHCDNCRRAVGAQSVAFICVPLATFSWLQGEPTRYRTDTGAWRTFCPRCGTSLTYEHDKRPGEIDLITGSLDEPERFPPNTDAFPEEHLSWVPLLTSQKE